MPSLASASELSHNDRLRRKNMTEYVCETTPKPAQVWYVDVKPSDLNNGKVILRFGDAKRAHRVRIKFWYSSHGKRHSKSFLTGDNGWVVIEGLKNGKRYSFRLRGESNCGIGKWSETVRTYP